MTTNLHSIRLKGKVVMPKKNHAATSHPAQAERTLPAHTATEDKLWAALHAHPGATAAELAAHAGIGKSTAGKVLVAWHTEGSVTRSSGSAAAGRRGPDRWQITETDDEASPAEYTEHLEPAADSDAEQADPTPAAEEPVSGLDITEPAAGTVIDASADANPSEPTKGTRLGKGALRGMVEDYLTEHPGEFSPNAIAHALGRSSGAVANALDMLVAHGYAVQTQDKPKRFTARKPTIDPVGEVR